MEKIMEENDYLKKYDDLIQKDYQIVEKHDNWGSGNLYYYVKDSQGNKKFIRLFFSVERLTEYYSEIKKHFVFLSEIKHPLLFQVEKIYESEDCFYVVKEIRELKTGSLLRNGPLAENQVIEYAIQLCDFMMLIHSMNPPRVCYAGFPNAFGVSVENQLILFEDGVIEQVNSCHFLGNTGFTAPEAFWPPLKGIDARTDIYGAGVLMYYWVTGHNPAQPPYEMYPIRHWNPYLSKRLEKIIIKCTQKNPKIDIRQPKS